MSSEASLWRYLQTILPRDGHYTRVESECSPGFPDVYYTLDGVSGTIELKSTRRPKAKYPFSGKDGLRRSQLIWIREETVANGRVILALRAAKEVFFLKGELYADDLYVTELDSLRRVANLWITQGEHVPLHYLSKLLTEEM